MTELQQDITTFGELQEGDWIIGSDGRPVQVLRAYEPHLPERMYELELEDGTVINASGNHLWYIEVEEDVLSHSTRLKTAKKLLKEKEWREEALHVAEHSTHMEIALEDLLNFFDFIPDETAKYFMVKRTLEAIGPIAEEETVQEDFLTGERGEVTKEVLYDARRAFQQFLSLSGDRKARHRWPVVVGRVVTTDTLFTRYPEAEIPHLQA